MKLNKKMKFVGLALQILSLMAMVIITTDVGEYGHILVIFIGTFVVSIGTDMVAMANEDSRIQDSKKEGL